MEEIINKIIEIDRKALTVNEKIKKLIENNEVQLNETLEDLESKELNKAKEIGTEKYQQLIKEGEDEKEKILLEIEGECDKLEKIFLNIHEDLEKRVIEEILNI